MLITGDVLLQILRDKKIKYLCKFFANEMVSKGCLLDLDLKITECEKKKTVSKIDVEVEKLAVLLGTDVDKLKKIMAYGNGKNE